ncbi:hypothetical protein ANN_01225 [Periplaneta americana]|uniref:CUB domain-containing protein n=1 Tax=Periplaneta americana TaxID=6978 RepID=A0ABQ8TT33_PERAM|nr:hypothetical protein ANN_01225 [Periplaneta americana]
MARLKGSVSFLFVGVFLAGLAVVAAEVEDGSATRVRGQGRTPSGRRRQQVIFSLSEQILTDPTGAVSFVQSARRRRPGAAQKLGVDKALLNETLSAGATDRDGRFLSLFTIVQFQNQGCAASSGDNGTCLTSAECTDRGGVASGPCANGYGVCCVFLATCGQSTKENCTYFVNQGYPGPYDGTGSCQLTINKANPDICQFRLDFDQFNVAGPEPVDNMCNNDQFIVAGGNPAPAICGINTGNHMYIDAGIGNTNPVTLNFVTSGPSFPRNWKVKICQIPCNTIYRAEEGCLQYFTGVSGQIKSFNYDPGAGLQLSKQDYSICIRMERNFCGIQYTSCPDSEQLDKEIVKQRSKRQPTTPRQRGISPEVYPQTKYTSRGSLREHLKCSVFTKPDLFVKFWMCGIAVNNRTHAFTMSGNTQGQSAVSSSTGTLGPNSCNADWIIIPCATNVGRTGLPACIDRICGGTFNTEISTTPSTIISTVKPFRLTVHTNNVEAPNDVGNRGFCLNYVQQPCTNNLDV